MEKISRIGDYKTITSIPGWVGDLILSNDRIKTPAHAYAYVPLIYRAMRLRCDSLSSVPVVLHQGENEIAWPFQNSTPAEFLWRTEAARLLSGAAYWLKLQRGRRVIGLQWLNPLTMTVAYRGGQVAFTQDVGTARYEYTADQIVYIPEFHPTDDIGPGISSTSVALADAELMHYITRFAASFFEGGAMPVVLLGIEGNPRDEDLRKTETFFRRAMSGLRNAWRVLGIRSGLIHPTVLTPAMRDMVMPELSEQARRSIALAFGIPQTMLEDAANYATASAHELSFWRSTVKPAGMAIVSAVNRQLFGQAVPQIEMSLGFESLDVFQIEESERAQSLSTFVDFLLKCPTFDIAREAASTFGYELTDGLLAAMQEWYGTSAAQTGEDESKPVQVSDDEQVIGDLRMWRKKSIRRLRAGKTPACEFSSEYIPAALAGGIEGQLETAQTADDIERIFADAIQGVTGGRA